MGCCFSKSKGGDPVMRLANAKPLAQKTLTFSTPMPHNHNQRHHGTTERLVPQDHQHEERPASDEESDGTDDDAEHSGVEDLEAQQYEAPTDTADTPKITDTADTGSGGRSKPRSPKARSSRKGKPVERLPTTGWLRKEPLQLKGHAKELAFKRKKRFFVLKAPWMLYYKQQCDEGGLKEDGEKALMKGGIKIAGKSQSSVVLQGKRLTVTGLTTKGDGVTLYAYVNDTDDGVRWRDAIQNAIHVTTDTTPDITPTGDDKEDIRVL